MSIITKSLSHYRTNRICALDELCVYGFIWEFAVANKMEIPFDVIIVCILMYTNAVDEWNDEYCSDEFEYDKDKRTLAVKNGLDKVHRLIRYQTFSWLNAFGALCI